MKNFINHDFNITDIDFICHLNAKVARGHHNGKNHHTISFMDKGKVDFALPDGTHGLCSDNYFTFAPIGTFTNHTTILPTSIYCIDFNTSETVDIKYFAVEIKNGSSLINLFSKANKLWTEKKPGYMMLCKAELYKILYTVQKELNTTYLPTGKQNNIQPAIDYIHSNYTHEVISVDFLANLCDISPSYLRRLFNNLYGVSPCEYINNLKVNHAKELLKSTDYKIDDIATLSGYSSSPYFSREFKKATGFSPSEYIKSNT